jgi:hypothetical protein
MPVNQDYAQFLTSMESAKFTNLWPAQEHVLQEYSSEYTAKSDIGIELPT